MSRDASAALPPGAALRRFVADFAASRPALAGSAMFVLIALAAILAAWIAPCNTVRPGAARISRTPRRPVRRDGYTHRLGTDDQGRDMPSGSTCERLRISSASAPGSAVRPASPGAALGSLAAYAGGRTDGAITAARRSATRLPVDPRLALMILAFLGKGVMNVLLALVIVEWGEPGRSARRRWSSGGANTSKPPNAWRCRGIASCSILHRRTACRRS